MAKVLAKRGVIASAEVKKANDAALDRMAQALDCPKDLVAVQIGGKYVACILTNDGSNADSGCRCTLEAKRAYSLAWRPDYEPKHIIETADAEVELILQHL